MFPICEDQISCSKINRSGNGLMDNLYHHGLPMSINELSFFQNHLILKYINTLILCQLIFIGGYTCLLM
jgi:hypothetical protein